MQIFTPSPSLAFMAGFSMSTAAISPPNTAHSPFKSPLTNLPSSSPSLQTAKPHQLRSLSKAFPKETLTSPVSSNSFPLHPPTTNSAFTILRIGSYSSNAKTTSLSTLSLPHLLHGMIQPRHSLPSLRPPHSKYVHFIRVQVPLHVSSLSSSGFP